MGSWLSDKYAEGTIGHRFYAGCQNIDTVESIAAEHARELFGAEYAYAAAAFGHRRQPGRLLGDPGPPGRAAGAGRARGQGHQRPHRGAVGDAAAQVRQPARARHVAGCRRPPDPRVPAQHLRQDVPPALLRHRSDDPADRLRPGAPGRAGVQAADPDRRLLRLSAADQLRQDARDRRRGRARPSWSTWRTSPAWWPGKVFTGDEDPVPHAHLVTTTTHKSLRGPRGGMVLATKEYADSVDRGCPMVLGGPLGHVMAAKAVALAEARTPSVPDLRPGGGRQRPHLRRRPAAPRGASWSPAAPTTTWS